MVDVLHAVHSFTELSCFSLLQQVLTTRISDGSKVRYSDPRGVGVGVGAMVHHCQQALMSLL